MNKEKRDAGRYRALVAGIEDADCDLVIVSKSACKSMGIKELPVKCAEDVGAVLDDYLAGCASFDAAVSPSGDSGYGDYT